eukprot:scaffold208796_cov66-Cyclotella_meneghiniana.AAC.1
MDRLASTIIAQEEGVTMATHAKYDRSWNLWCKFLSRIPTKDKYLSEFTQNQRNTIIAVFVDTVKNGEFTRNKSTVKGTTAREAADHVSKIIESCGWPDPRLNISGKTCIQITRQGKAYKDEDGPTKHQKALPPEVYRWWLRHAEHPREKARAHLLAGALFFAMRSCEYSKTPHEEQKTKPIRPMDITFRIGAEVISHKSQRKYIAENVEIIFRIQKNGVIEDQILQWHTNDKELCPVKHWATTIDRLRSYPKYNDKWPVYYFFDKTTNKPSSITSREIAIDIKAAVDAIGPKTLGFTSHDVGTHSNRAGFAMMMYLSGRPVYTIMLLGRWLSDAFLRYIEKQIKEFSKGASEKMLLHNTFYNLPVRPWTETDTANSHSAGHYHRPIRRQIFGPG